MAISMNTNTTAMSSTLVMDKAHQKLSTSHQNMGKGTKQLSAADSQIIGKMAREVSGLKVGQTNIKKATSMLGIAQGAFQSVNDLLTQMKEKAFAATNVANGVSERKAYQEEFSSLGKQLERVFTNTTFNGEKLLAKGGKLDGKLVFQTGTQNSTPMNADFTSKLDSLMKGIDDEGTKTTRANASGGGTDIGKKYFDALTKLVKAEDTARSYAEAVEQEEAARAAVGTKTWAPGAFNGITAGMMSVFADNTATQLSATANITDVATAGTGDEVKITTSHKIAANTLANAAGDEKLIASDDTVAEIKKLATAAANAVRVAQTELDIVKDDADFVHKGALNLRITDNQKSQEATVALEKLALSFDEMNSDVQALMDSMKAQGEMQSTVINKTEEAIGATRDTDYMEETSNIAAAKLRNVTAMAAVKQSYEITSTIINTLVNVNN
ncbi:flagellin [Yersinia enterocolitica]|uniref:flagellin N-terminal helical domain-containing protein n=1 Tax=Yersinia enterocolitica TaxID=630 RepID=UPI001C8E2AC0|nr:flagellin [Yersinia enterocolitica]MBX9480918.1 flagellin [Yersinia enterocolitica]